MSKPQAQDGNKSKIQVIKWMKPTSLTQEEAEARLHQEGYEAFCWNDVPGASYPRHRHDSDECLWILRGEIRLTIQGEDYLLQAGDRIYLPANTPHTAEVPQTRGVTYFPSLTAAGASFALEPL
jgi:quercetin dioxygenase-like cupin family protein